MAKISRFLDWLFPVLVRRRLADASPAATCEHCGQVLAKQRMIYSAPYGWFCNAQELERHYGEMYP